MKLRQILQAVLVASFVSSPALAAVANSSARFTEVWSLDLSGALPPEEDKAAFRQTGNVGSIPCADGRAYFSEGGNMQGGWSMASFVCHRNRDRNSAHWVIYLPRYPSDMFDRQRLLGIDCSFAGDGWRCRKRIRMQSPIEPTFRRGGPKEDPDAFNYIRIL